MSAQRPSARAFAARPSRSAAVAEARPKASAGPRLTRTGLSLGGREIALYSGALHYFRVPKEHWRPALKALRELGLGLVESYVPWGVHEAHDGSRDFGEIDPQKNLGAFLDLAEELGLYVFLRPGPNVNAELAHFGLPKHVALDARNQALSPRGHALHLAAPPRVFPVASYASRHFREQTADWFHAVAKEVAPRCWPRGPVVLLQADNETAFFFRDGPYDSDYHPDALADFARSLEARYNSIEALNFVYATNFTSFAEVQAPTRFTATTHATLPPYLDWIAFHETLLCDALATASQQLRSSGLDVPVVHNLPMGEGGLPTSLSAVGNAVDLVGLDYYHRQSSLETVRRRTLRLVGNTPLAFSPELGVGAPPWFAPRSESDSLTCAMTACAYGLRAFNLYMAVDRDRWYGAPIDAGGAPRPSAENWRRFIAALRDTEFHRLTRHVEVALCIPKEYAQLSRATHALGALSPSLLDLAGLPASSACRQDPFGFSQPIQLAWEAQLAHLDQALCSEQIPFVYVESDRDLDALPDLRVVFAPSFEFADPARWQRLMRFAERGGKVVWGPHLPTLDQRMRAQVFPPLGERPPSSILDLESAQALVREIAEQHALTRPWPITPAPLHTTVHNNENGACVFFVINPSKEDLRAEVQLPLPLVARDPMNDERFSGEDTLALPSAAQSCRMLIVNSKKSRRASVRSGK